MFDILIIGAGPAGSNLARLLAQSENTNRYSVCLLDKRRLDAPADPMRQKACGGLLSPDAQKIMARLGLSLPASVLENPQIFKVRTIDFDNNIERYYPRNYLNMDRERFDRYLYDLVPKSVDKRCGMVVTQIHAMDGYWEVHYRNTNENPKDTSEDTQVVKAKFLVGADGANSFVRRQCIPKSAHTHKYFSIQKWYTLKESMPYYTGIFDREITDYYSWTIQKGEHLILGTAIPCRGNGNATDSTNQSADQRFDLFERKISEHLGLYLGKPLKVEGAYIERTMRPKDLCFSSRYKVMNGQSLPIALVGEAAGATSPTSAEGFSYAFISSLKLYEALEGGLKNAERRYDAACGEIRRNLVFKKLKSPAMYWPVVRGIVMSTGLTSIKEPTAIQSTLLRVKNKTRKITLP